LDPSEAAAKLGVTTKALRVYEREGLVTPGRRPTSTSTSSGVSLRALARVLLDGAKMLAFRRYALFFSRATRQQRPRIRNAV